MRFVLRELTGSRISAAVKRRALAVPDVIAWKVSAQAQDNRARLEDYRDCHRGQRCVIMGNGPSLAKMDLSRLRTEVTFGLNRIYLLFDRLNFVPSYFTCVNELVLQQFSSEIARMAMPKFVAWQQRQLFRDAKDVLYVQPGMTMQDFFARDPRQTICSGGTVTYVALQLAYYMGFREVILIGVDHHFADSGVPNKTEVRTAERDENHFHPDYFARGTRWQLPDLLRSEQAYALARAAFEADGRRVLDATVGGRCQVFDKVDYNQLFH